MIKMIFLFAMSVLVTAATPITYTIAGTGSGLFYLPNPFDPNAKATPFTDQPFSFAIQSDTSQVRVPLAGENLASATNPQSVFVTVGSESGYLNESARTQQYGLMGLLGFDDTLALYISVPGDPVLSISNPAFSGYDLASSIGPLTGPTQLNPQQKEMALFIPVSFSTVNFQSISDVTFEASLVTPEPLTYALVGMSLATFGVFRKRRALI